MNATETVIENADIALLAKTEEQEDSVSLRDLTTLELSLVGGGMGLASFY
jgi:hypothetical protein